MASRLYMIIFHSGASSEIAQEMVFATIKFALATSRLSDKREEIPHAEEELST